MLEMGIFEGHYTADCAKEFPSSWYSTKCKHNPDKPDEKLNYFGIKSR